MNCLKSNDNMEIISLAPKFLNFYEKAKDEDETKVWELWKRYYNFAAVPPGEAGEKMAKNMLQQAWGKYSGIVPYLESWKPNSNKIEAYLNQVKQLLGCDHVINMVIIFYVGFFEHNAFVAPYDNERNALCLPIEDGDNDITIVHELTHIVHSKTAGLTDGWERPIATLVFQEGLATNVSKHLVPGKPDKTYIEHREGWLDQCKKQSSQIYKGIEPYLEDSSSQRLYDFTMGIGPAGNEREGYFAGWQIVGELLNSGMSFQEIAEVKEKDMPQIIRRITG